MAPALSSACITGQYLGEHHGSQAMNLHDSFFIRLVLKAHFGINSCHGEVNVEGPVRILI